MVEEFKWSVYKDGDIVIEPFEHEMFLSKIDLMMMIKAIEDWEGTIRKSGNFAIVSYTEEDYCDPMFELNG